ncbi:MULTISPECIES: PQQ-dependent sugar dehydrogenase [unclassified Knoellia]|uniref:PQQ-dependent sugar dehydrogenase n=1 Tax=Knoellia altitudinis TaxID=3404795 RepID=UPI00360F044B
MGRYARILVVGALVAGTATATLAPGAAYAGASPQSVEAKAAALAAAAEPASRLTTVASGLALPWDVAPLPSGEVLFTQRGGATRIIRTSGGVQTVSTAQGDLFVGSESGLMGLVIDPGFATNRTYYTCQAYRGSGTSAVDIRVLRWVLAASGTSASRSGSPVVTGIPVTSGQHGGCRLRFAADRTLHVGTGDAIVGTSPQDLGSLGGKTLRVSSSGVVPSSNPFSSRGGNAAKVWTYGHRNVQGLALRPGTSEMWSAEHGPDVDDEVNRLVPGRNYGWDPVPGYNQNVPMTDLAKFPSAVLARWRSGRPTVATSGATFLTGSRWGRWEGALAVAELKNSGVRVLSLTPDGRVRGDEQVDSLDGSVGRIRTVQSAANGSMFVSTSNGSGDRVLRLDPTATPQPFTSGLDVSPSGVSAVVRNGAVTVFVRATDGRVMHTTQAVAGGAFGAWQMVQGTITSAPTAVTWGGSRVDLFARGPAGTLVHTYSNGGAFAPWGNLGGSIRGAPTAASLSSGTLDAVARSGDALWRIRWDGTRWTPWSTIHGGVSSAPAAAADRTSGTVRVLVRGRDGRLWDSILTSTGIRRGWAAVGSRQTSSAPAVTPGSGVVLTRNGVTPVVAIGSFVTAIGGELTGAPAVASRGTDSWVAFGRGNDGALWTYDGRPGRHTWSRVGGALG